jgi:hypothetical protein
MRSVAATNDRSGHPPSGKISREFSARLAQLKPKDKIRAVVLLRPPETNGKPSGARPTREERRAAVDNVLSSASVGLREIDEILERFNGRRLSEQPSALSTVGVETTAAGISALTESDHVKAVLEDQALSLVR